ncbi:GlxA family transcriptional regulator [Pelagibius marinus]|uniref:GlxA family transcriptional regulator n=1 Tax=Pelagibius marinus TaxID=2762760 RepID=UPI0018727173|nr:helix-turn-helix domain-containing protein [Pelagibius marinus]
MPAPSAKSSRAAKPTQTDKPIRVCLLALPESSASVLYGLYDVLSSAGRLWSQITGEPEAGPTMEVEIVSPSREPFRCWGGLPVAPQASLAERPQCDLVVVSDLAIPIDFDPRGAWPESVAWVRQQHAGGAVVAAVCTGSVLLAEAGLLDGRAATTHWAFEQLFATYFPEVNLSIKDVMLPDAPGGQIVTSGGAAAWEDLVLHLIARFCGDVEARRMAKTFLMGDRSDGQLPYAAMVKPQPHEDQVITGCQVWIADHYAAPNPVSRMVERSGLPERSFKRRFRRATGFTPVAYVQTLRVEEAKEYLETTDWPTEQVGVTVGYEDPAFFRRLFKRHTGITPARYRQRFRGLSKTTAVG